MLMGSSYRYGDSLRFMCRLGYTPSRTPARITCLTTGKWDGEPECTANCKQGCLNGGRCLGLNRCKCMPGWAGRRCELPICILPCLNGGRCVAPYRCRCPEGYTGSSCSHETEYSRRNRCRTLAVFQRPVPGVNFETPLRCGLCGLL
ncbi:sushi, von Willebrand factor type A, EGF and pentraxin domain-containing protein 1 [Aplysia californica]|uniref:Sushi, von Willebrand factor type A, EGF and pentraxin domain-containing protein 1 n=1 Tax=Aplysia californica TaxID=6500 RepID=A0ABM1A011_APLCA|nr:sushi, von Willebrand factor type A, EGF and pentraxin domain-containing protein 1 [Aplysia californica]